MPSDTDEIAGETLWLCEPDWVPHLRAELRQVWPKCNDKVVSPSIVAGMIGAKSDGDAQTVALARQCLPNAEELSAESIGDWAELLGSRLIELIPEDSGNWRLHLLSSEGPDSPRPGRLKLIDAALDDFLRRKQRRLRRTRIADRAAPWNDAPNLAQVLLTTPTRGYLSVCIANERAAFRRMISRYPGGIAPQAIDKSAPSRAFAKLVEALAEWGSDIEPGDQVVDLGASPGSWTWLALGRGAQVIAIDRSPLRDDLMSDPELEFHSGDAFAYEPKRPVDWLLSDLIAFPERIIELLEKWLTHRWCRQFCVTIKFRGNEDYPRLAEVKHLLHNQADDFLLRRLNANKNEVTAIGRARS